jgi:hypothetical protein
MGCKLNLLFSALGKCLLTIFTYFLLIGCDNSDKISSSYRVDIDSVKFKISPEFLDYYVNYDILDEQNLFVGYNHFDHSLQFIDLNSKETVQTIKLERDGPNRIKTISELFVLGDKIYLKSTPEWVTIDHNGKVLR